MNIRLDAGGVLFICGASRSEDTDQTSKFIPGCIEYVHKLAEDGHTLIVNSFAGKARGVETKKSIRQHLPWILDKNVFVVDDRKKKWIICNEHKLDIMVDDRHNVLETIEENFRQANLPCPILIWLSEEKRKTRFIQVTSSKILYSCLKNLHRQHRYRLDNEINRLKGINLPL